jgi:hypothetical protein
VPDGTFETTVEVGAEFLVRRVRGGSERPDDELAAGRELLEALTAQMPETTLNAMADHGAAHGTTDDEPHAREAVPLDDQMYDEGVTPAAATGARDPTQVVAPSEAMLRREHGRQDTR